MPIVGSDGAPDEYGINPKTGNYNIGGYDLTEADLYTLSNISYSGYSPEQCARIFIKLKQNNGRITGKDLIDMELAAQPGWLESIFGNNPDNAANLLISAYNSGQNYATFADFDAQERQEKFNNAFGLVALAAMSGKGLFGNSETKGISGKSASDMFNDEIEKTSGTRYTQGKTLPETKGNGGVLDKGNFAQKDFSEAFSNKGQKVFSQAAGRPIQTIDDLTTALRNGEINVNQVTIDYIVRDGNILILNTRSSQALVRAGIPRNQWNVVDRTNQTLYENMLTNQLTFNNLTSAGIPIAVSKQGGYK